MVLKNNENNDSVIMLYMITSLESFMVKWRELSKWANKTVLSSFATGWDKHISLFYALTVFINKHILYCLNYFCSLCIIFS